MRFSLRQAIWAAALAAPFLVVLACDDSTSAPSQLTATGPSAAFGIWAPGAGDTCPASVHDQYAVVGPDLKLYPTWHPPTDPVTGCTFGHEHGRDPSGSDLYREVGPMPFGFANEQLAIYDPLNPRNEDHVGHKIEWENDIRLHLGGAAAGSLFDVRCDVLTKMHQGTHSRDAFTNNLHELAYHIRCSDGLELHVTLMSAVGDPGEFVRSCDRDITVQVGPATPANSPQGGGARIIPDRACVDSLILVTAGEQSRFGALHESWETSNSIRSVSGHEIAFFNPYFQVGLPSRFHDPALAGIVGRPIDVCYESDSVSGRRARGGDCEEATANGTIAGITYTDPRSPFKGADRVVDINYNHVRNAEGPAIWFTNPFGREAQPDSFPGAIRQYISRFDNDRGGLGNGGPTLGRSRAYGLPIVHPPN